MAMQFWQGEESRKIRKRIVVEGDLVLQTPTHFGNGDSVDETDMPLLTDALDNKTPILTGATLAGALRSFLRERERGYGAAEESADASVLLFGGMKQDDDGAQSPLLIDDARARENTFGVELREGVRINRASRTAEHGMLYDAQTWQAGTIFPLRFELLICGASDEAALKRALATALEGLQNGEISFGMRKRRGLGAVKVSEWRAREYDLSDVNDLLAWIETGDKPLPPEKDDEKKKDIWKMLQSEQAKGGVADQRAYFEIDATFWLDGSLLIRSQGGKDDTGPDMAYLRARQAGGKELPVLSGTSLAGALRARAEKIVRTLAPGKGDAAADWVDGLFGTDMEKARAKREKIKASRLRVSEQVVKNAIMDLAQSRVSIDRFTGGAFETALFNEQPAFGDQATTLQIKLVAQKPRKGEIGLLLLLLKDLWTGDLALGGESSVGRGRLRGKHATLTQMPKDGGKGAWEIREEIVEGKSVMHLPDDIKTLNDWVTDLQTALNEVQVQTNEFVTTGVQA
jgi:CRISPR/Cas system CSM-associated protein Csm3 (group 7 of RAMP superfamily)